MMLLSVLLIAFCLRVDYSHCQSSQQTCQQDRLQRCQQDITLVTGSSSSSGTSDAGYGSSDSHGQGFQDQNKCSNMRQNLDCLLNLTPACQGADTYRGTNNNDIIWKAKQYLDRNCDQNGGYQSSSCYQRQDLKTCETQLSIGGSRANCGAFNTFRSCASNFVRTNCQPQDQALLSSYLIDKGQELAWQCSPIDRQDNFDGQRYQSGSGSYGSGYGSGSSGGSGSYPGGQGSYGTGINNQGGYGSGGGYGSDRHVGQGGYGQGGYGQGQGGYGQGQGGYGQGHGGQGGYGEGQRGHGGQGGYGSGGFGTGTGVGTGGIGGDIDHGQDPHSSGAGNRNFGLFPAENCVERASYYARSCEDTLLQRQREARNGRTAIDVQRRICCSLFFYRDCLSKTVIQYCRDANPTTVDILMGQRRRELTVTCRDFSRDQCNGSHGLKVPSLVIMGIALLALFS